MQFKMYVSCNFKIFSLIINDIHKMNKNRKVGG